MSAQPLKLIILTSSMLIPPLLYTLHQSAIPSYKVIYHISHSPPTPHLIELPSSSKSPDHHNITRLLASPTMKRIDPNGHRTIAESHGISVPGGDLLGKDQGSEEEKVERVVRRFVGGYFGGVGFWVEGTALRWWSRGRINGK
jgi:hypothetical protein